MPSSQARPAGTQSAEANLFVKSHPDLDTRLQAEDLRRQNLRIADASIMPTITTGNTHAPCVLIGERLAEILRG